MPEAQARLCELPLRGGGGEPISFVRTIRSHGCAALAPAVIASAPLRYVRALRIGTHVVPVSMRQARDKVVVEGPRGTTARERTRIAQMVARMFRFDDDLSRFYAIIDGDPILGWAANGAGRLLASPTVFEDVVKTICTTNCAWSATVRMTNALTQLGGGAFPEPETIARTPASWFADTARTGYRGPYIAEIARRVVAGDVDLEALRPNGSLSDEAVEQLLHDLPGVGPYAAAHIMQLLGRHRNLVLDSWTRPAYLRLAKKKRAKDTTIARAFARYKEYAGLAFWLYLTRGWVEES